MAAHGERYLDIHKVADKVGLSTRTVRRKVKAREFPPPFRWGGGFAWLESEVDRWMVKNAAVHTIDPDEMEVGSDKSADNRGQSGTSCPEGGNPGSGRTKGR